ncbi:Hint domain-containing protein [Ruegeria aquimaris]|uniref:Hint domain-containing protein n=1 Tax=Ruegeria aquimaris TaxID=2984333 RepID=A0ABT3AKT1_9RHOB|nr:Hint domain-containing protein [Ruegeria sp. XHP0148]MCV2889202.1 Hint domain-containing protein [Ruegeria sp. XHP0148]
MAQEHVLIYNFASGDSTYPHSGSFTIGVAGFIKIDDSDGFRDSEFGDFTHTGGADVPDQNVTESTVAGIDVGDTVDLRYKYTITGSDGSSGTVYFIATNSTSDYGPLMASDFPLQPGVTYTFRTFNTDGAVAYDDLVVCFVAGTLIRTKAGERPIETLCEGDLIRTQDHGLQPLRWIGRRHIWATSRNAPIVFAPGALSNHSELRVSPNHRMLVSSARAELYFGDPEVLVPAKHLLCLDGVHRAPSGPVTYVHLLFDRHEVVFANGAPSESFYPGPQALNALEQAAQDEVLSIFPELETRCGLPGETARMALTRLETQVLHGLVH